MKIYWHKFYEDYVFEYPTRFKGLLFKYITEYPHALIGDLKSDEYFLKFICEVED